MIVEDIMARTPIHPGEHLALELNELGMSAPRRNSGLTSNRYASFALPVRKSASG
jgi:hypothetical protein